MNPAVAVLLAVGWMLAVAVGLIVIAALLRAAYNLVRYGHGDGRRYLAEVWQSGYNSAIASIAEGTQTPNPFEHHAKGEINA